MRFAEFIFFQSNVWGSSGEGDGFEIVALIQYLENNFEKSKKKKKGTGRETKGV